MSSANTASAGTRSTSHGGDAVAVPASSCAAKSSRLARTVWPRQESSRVAERNSGAHRRNTEPHRGRLEGGHTITATACRMLRARVTVGSGRRLLRCISPHHTAVCMAEAESSVEFRRVVCLRGVVEAMLSDPMHGDANHRVTPHGCIHTQDMLLNEAHAHVTHMLRSDRGQTSQETSVGMAAVWRPVMWLNTAASVSQS